MSNSRPLVGLGCSSVSNLKEAVNKLEENGFSFLHCPLVNPRFCRESTDLGGKTNKFTRSDLSLTAREWCTILTKLSDHYDCDSPDNGLRMRSETFLEEEIMYSTHLGIFFVTVNIHSRQHENLARLVCKVIQSHPLLQVWGCVPLTSFKTSASSLRNDSEPIEECTWSTWHKFHGITGYDKNVGVILELTADLPCQTELDRWLGEPLRGLILPTSIFLTNKKGYPVLSQAHQLFVRKVSHVCSRVILTGVVRHNSLKDYSKYIHHILNMSLSNIPAAAKGYEDILQIPLQPLGDNLESSTYEVFEKDPIKYTFYKKAIYQALVDRSKEGKKEQIVAVVGAGRGPLVSATLTAAVDASVQVTVFAVEKNPNACITLCDMKETYWKDSVTLFNCDMRDWCPPEKCDILVSELLGSFGDNELSPECLDGAQRFLKDDGISIPCKYTSYLKPIQSCKLYNEALHLNTLDKPKYTAMESPYVVHQSSVYSIAPEQPVFVFEHPNWEPHTNDRYKILDYEVKLDCVLHGFSGYFDFILYKDVMLSIVPKNHSQGMFSWFPMFFPIKSPIDLKAGDNLQVHMWRLSDRTKVWYEWNISEPVTSHVHNSRARSYSVSLY